MTEQISEADLEKAATDFFENKKIVIVDHSPACREGVKGVLLDYGVYDNQVKTFSRFDEAHQYIEQEKPEVIMTEYSFKGTRNNNHWGLEPGRYRSESLY